MRDRLSMRVLVPKKTVVPDAARILPLSSDQPVSCSGIASQGGIPSRQSSLADPVFRAIDVGRNGIAGEVSIVPRGQQGAYPTC